MFAVGTLLIMWRYPVAQSAPDADFDANGIVDFGDHTKGGSPRGDVRRRLRSTTGTPASRRRKTQSSSSRDEIVDLVKVNGNAAVFNHRLPNRITEIEVCRLREAEDGSSKTTREVGFPTDSTGCQKARTSK